MKISDHEGYVEHFQRRVLQDAFTEVSASYWRRRAEIYVAALPRPGDFTGLATAQEIEARLQRVAALVLACRQKAELMPGGRIA